MRTKFAIALSTLGVLSAGSAAALVNTDILDNEPAASGASAAILPPPVTVDLSVPAAVTSPTTSSTVSSTSSTPTTSSTVPSPTTSSVPGSSSTSSLPASGPTGMLTTYTVGSAGSVTVDLINGRLVFVRAEPAAGWSVAETEADDSDEVEVEFRSGDTRVEFRARFENGAIVPEVKSETVTQTTTVTTIDDDNSGSGGGDDDDHNGTGSDDDGDDDHSGAGSDDDGGDDDGDDDHSGSGGDDDSSGRDHAEDD